MWSDTISSYLEWARETFPEATPESCITHLRHEVNELTEDPRDPLELADAFMLVVHTAHLAGVNLENAVLHKLRINREREWGPVNEEGFREHDRSLDEK